MYIFPCFLSKHFSPSLSLLFLGMLRPWLMTTTNNREAVTVLLEEPEKLYVSDIRKGLIIIKEDRRKFSELQKVNTNYTVKEPEPEKEEEETEETEEAKEEANNDDKEEEGDAAVEDAGEEEEEGEGEEGDEEEGDEEEEDGEEEEEEEGEEEEEEEAEGEDK